MNFDLTQLVLLAFLVEALLQTIKPLYDKEKGWNRSMILSIVLGVAICGLAGVDLFEKVGIPLKVPVVGSLLTGVIASRGSNFVHDIFRFVQGKAEEQSQGPVGVG